MAQNIRLGINEHFAKTRDRVHQLEQDEWHLRIKAMAVCQARIKYDSRRGFVNGAHGYMEWLLDLRMVPPRPKPKQDRQYACLHYRKRERRTSQYRCEGHVSR